MADLEQPRLVRRVQHDVKSDELEEVRVHVGVVAAAWDERFRRLAHHRGRGQQRVHLSEAATRCERDGATRDPGGAGWEVRAVCGGSGACARVGAGHNELVDFPPHMLGALVADVLA